MNNIPIEEMPREIDRLLEENERLNNIIDKVIEDLKSTKELNDKHILARDNIIVNLDIDHIDYLLDILKEKE